MGVFCLSGGFIPLLPIIRILKRNLCCEIKQKMKVLNVAEKNDAAKSIATVMSRGGFNRREGFSQYNKIYEFDHMAFGERCTMVMTSVSGHLQDLDFTGQYKSWKSCPPLALFDAPVSLFVPEAYLPIKRSLHREARGAQKLIIWTDCDREGENIGFEIINVVKEVNPKIEVLRARFSEITNQSVTHALMNLTAPDKRMSDAVEVRRELDLRIGAAFTRFLTMRYQVAYPELLKDLIVSYGSCQFPTLGFVVERYKQILEFIPEPFWKLRAMLEEDGKKVEFNWRRVRLFDHSAVKSLYDLCIDNPVATVVHIQRKSKSKWRPQALDTVEFEKSMCKKLRITAKEAMAVAEKLYTRGLISYPRTETNQFPKDFGLRDLVENQTVDPQWGGFASGLLNDGITPRNGIKSDQAHPPIHPTKYTDSLQGLEFKVYEFVVRHFLACCAKDAQGFETTAEVDIAGEKFFASGLVITARNYLDVYPYDKWTDKDMPNFCEGDQYQPSVIEMVAGETSAPSLLSEADLITLMEKHNIGTDATHAEHIEKIKERCYVGVQQDGKLLPGQLGMGLVEGYDVLGFEFSKPKLRAGLEEDLKLICLGQRRPEDVLRDQVKKYRDLFEASLNRVQEIDEQMKKYMGDMKEMGQNNTALSAAPLSPRVCSCPHCGSDMVLRQRTLPTQQASQRPGAEQTQRPGFYLGCMGYPECRSALWLPDCMFDVQALEQRCAKCPDVKKLKIRFKPHSVPPHVPLDYCGCIMCDKELKEIFQLSIKNGSAAVVQRPVERGTGNTHPRGMGGTRKMDDKQQTAVRGQTIGIGSVNTSIQMRGRGHSKERSNSAGSQVGLYRGERSQNGESEHLKLENGLVCACGQLAVTLTVRKDGPNQGRQFAKCSKPLDAGGCNFFAWADDSSLPSVPVMHKQALHSGHHVQGETSLVGKATGIGGVSGGRATSQPSMSTDGAVMVRCPCGHPAARLTVVKEGANQGRPYFRCAHYGGQSCDFFKWADGAQLQTTKLAREGKENKIHNPSSGSAGSNKRKCGHCRKEGHTKRSCPELRP